MENTLADSPEIQFIGEEELEQIQQDVLEFLPQIEEWFEFIGEKLPTGVKDEFEALKQRLAEAD